MSIWGIFQAFLKSSLTFACILWFQILWIFLVSFLFVCVSVCMYFCASSFSFCCSSLCACLFTKESKSCSWMDAQVRKILVEMKNGKHDQNILHKNHFQLWKSKKKTTERKTECILVLISKPYSVLWIKVPAVI